MINDSPANQKHILKNKKASPKRRLFFIHRQRSNICYNYSRSALKKFTGGTLVSKFLEVRFKSYQCTLEIRNTSCGWLEIIHVNGENNGKRIHCSEDEELIRLYITENLHGEILSEHQ